MTTQREENVPRRDIAVHDPEGCSTSVDRIVGCLKRLGDLRGDVRDEHHVALLALGTLMSRQLVE